MPSPAQSAALQNLEELQIPLAVTGQNIVTGEPAVFTSGELLIQWGSCAIRHVPPGKVGSRCGDGLLATRPAMPLRDMGASA